MQELKLLVPLIFLSVQVFAQSTIHVPQDYTSIQDALDSAQTGDTVLVSPGTYFETIRWPGSTNIKLLSEAGREVTIIDGIEDKIFLRPVFIIDSFHGPKTEINGFTIRNGTGGIYVSNSSPTFENLIIEENSIRGDYWGAGAGMYLSNSRSTIENCIFRSNWIEGGDHSLGAGLHGIHSGLTIDSCQFISNVVDAFFRSEGAGLFLTNFSDFPIEEYETKITNCVFSDNQVFSNFFAKGAAMHINNSVNVEITNTVLASNSIENVGNPSGIGIVNSEVDIINCTITQNQKGILVDKSTLGIVNSILYSNGDEEIIDVVGNEIDITFSLVSNGYSGEGNIDGDPEFISDEILIPIESSICINSGDPDLSLPTDILGNPRPQPVNTVTDMGAYEINQTMSAVNSDDVDLNVIVSPNPSNSRFCFSEELECIELFDAKGNTLFAKTKTHEVDLEGYAPGLYFAKIKQGRNMGIIKLVLSSGL